MVLATPFHLSFNACGGVSGDDHCEEVITSIGWVSTCEPNTGLVLVLGIEKKIHTRMVQG